MSVKKNSTALCLNHNDPQVRLWFKNVGEEETYRQYILNDESLPDWNDNITMNFGDVKSYMSTFIPVSSYKYENINNILFKLPINTQAAFWNDTFYFKDKVSKGEVGEEVFHSVIGTILDDSQRKEFYSVAEEYISSKGVNINTLISNAIAQAPTIYQHLSSQDLRNRILEEQIAGEFRDWFISQPDLKNSFGGRVGKFLQDLFEMIASLFRSGDRQYIKALFRDIKNSKYKNSNVIFSENATPSTYLLMGTSPTGTPQQIGEAESEQVMRNLVANYFKIKHEMKLVHKDALNELFDRTRVYYQDRNSPVAGAFVEKETSIDEDTLEDIEVSNPDFINLVKELEKRIIDAAPYSFDPIEEDQGDENTDENVTDNTNIYSTSDSSSANEVGFDSISKWLKTYIKTVGISHTIKLSDGREVEFLEAVDENKIYYGVARALNNSVDDYTRLMKLISFSEHENNNAANALLMKVIKDSTGSTTPELVIQGIKNDYKNIYLKTNDPSVINNYINSDRAYILQNVLKGFDLWSRVNMFQTVSPETGRTKTNNANVNNAITNQLGKWQQKQTSNLNPPLTELSKIVAQVAPVGNINSKISQSVKATQKALYKALGVSVNSATVRWLILNNSINANGVENYGAQDVLDHSIFANEIKTYATGQEINSLLTSIRDEVNADNIKDLYDSKIGVRNRLELLATINALFDENVFESSYKNAEGKTIYGFQWKTFDLEFVANLQDDNFTDSLINNGLTAYRKDAEGNDVYLNESLDFIQNNLFLKKMYVQQKNGKYKKDKNHILNKILPYMKLESLDGLRQVKDDKEVARVRAELQIKLSSAYKSSDINSIARYKDAIAYIDDLQGREGEGVTFSNMLTKDFDLIRLNMAVNKQVKVKVGNNSVILYPHYIANLEAKRTADFIYLPEIEEELISNGTLNDVAINYIKEEIRKEFDRIKRVHAEMKEAIEQSDLITFNEDNEAKLSSTLVRNLLKKDAFEKYHTGVIKKRNIDGAEVYSGLRAFEFTDGILGVLDKKYMKNELTNAALLNQDLEIFWKENDLSSKIKSHWKDVIFKEHYDRLEYNDLLPNLDSRWKDQKGQLLNNKFEKYIVGSFISTLAFNQLMHGDNAVLFKNDGADFAKRKGGANAANQSSETFITAPTYGITEVKRHVKYVTANEMQSVVAYEPGVYNKKKNKFERSGIDQADAQNYASVEYKRYLLWSKGKLTRFLADTLDSIELGYALTEAQKKIMLENKDYLNVDKTVAYNGVQYLKKSDFMLTKEFTSMLTTSALERLKAVGEDSEEAKNIRRDENNWVARPDAEFHHNIRQSMEGWRRDSTGKLTDKDKATKKYDLYMPTSASKMLNVNVFDPSVGWNNIDESILQISAKNYGLQLENPAGKERIIDPSQMIEIIFNEQDGNVQVLHKGEPKTMASLEELYQDYLTKRDNSVFDMAHNEIFDSNNKFDAKTFFPKAVASLIGSGADPQVVELFKLNEYGEPEYNPNMGITKEKFTNLLFAHFTKGVLQQKVAGDALAHVSSYGIKPLKKIRRIELGANTGVYTYTWDVVKRDTDDYNTIAYSGKYKELNLEADSSHGNVIYDPTLPTDTLRETLEGMYLRGELFFTDELRHLKPRYVTDFYEGGEFTQNKPMAYYSESLLPAYRLDDQSPNENNKWSFGVRIPSQDKHSAVNVEWVDSMPMYYGNTIITAKEIVTISGSDFDIDKLFIHKPELYKNSNGKVVKYGTGNPWVEYMEYLKSHHSEFKERYYKLVSDLRKRDTDVDDRYNSLRDEVAIMKESGDASLSDKILVYEGAIIDMYNNYLDQKKRNDEIIRKPLDLLRELRLPTDITNWDNPYALNNDILELKQIALTNEGTLLSKTLEDGTIIPAIYKTAATMDVLKDLDKQDLFKDENGVSVFAQTDNLPNHIFNKHSITHTKNSVGKANINPYVNGNLALVLAIRAGFKVNSGFEITINNHTFRKFGYLSAGNQRIFDSLSSLISAATDEAKEQLNAKYKLNLEAAGIAKTMVSMGWNFETVMLYVNQPVVQAYLKSKQDRNQTVFLENEFKSEDDIVASLVGDPSTGFYSEQVTDDMLADKIKNTETDFNTPFNKRVMKDLLVINHINSQMSLLTRFMKVKKGFVGGLEQLDQLNEAMEGLGFFLGSEKAVESFEQNNPLNTHETLNPTIAKRIPQIINVIENIIPRMNDVANQLLLDRNPDLRALKGLVKSQFKGVNTKVYNSFVKDIESYLFMRLYIEELGDTNEDMSVFTNNLFIQGDDHATVGQTFIALKAEVARIEQEGATTPDEQRLKNLSGTSILNRLTVKTITEKVFGTDQVIKYDELKLDTFAKMSAQEQDTLITSFSLLIKNLNSLSDSNEQFKSLPKQMFAYWVMKDAFQSKFGSVSKLFPVYEFKDHSNSIDRALSNRSEAFNGLKTDDIYDVYLNDILKRIATNSYNSSLVKTFYKGINKDVPVLHKGYSINLGEANITDADTLAKVSANYSVNIVLHPDGNPQFTNIPFYTKTKVKTENNKKETRVLQLSSIENFEGVVIPKGSKQFYPIVLGRPEKIKALNYTIVASNPVKFQSAITADMNYTSFSEDLGMRLALSQDESREGDGKSLPLLDEQSDNQPDMQELEEIESSPISLDSFKYYGAMYSIVVEDDKAVDVMGYKGANKAKQKIIDAYNTNANVDPQNGKPFRIADTPVNSGSKISKYELFPGVYANEEQVKAIDSMTAYLASPSQNGFFVLEGKGGVGKTTIIKKVLQTVPFGKSVHITALSHKAKEVAKQAINNNFYKYSALAGFLGMTMDLATGKFTTKPTISAYQKNQPPVETADVIIVDEASMINEQALQIIMESKKPNAKVIFMGDRGQLPPIREQEDQEHDGKISPVFTAYNKSLYSQLFERMRQGEESPILPFADYYWNNSDSEKPVLDPIPAERRENIENEKGKLIFIKPKDILNETAESFKKQLETKNPNLVKIVVYRNETRRRINTAIRNLIFDNPGLYEKGDILMFEDSYDEFENSQEIVVDSYRVDEMSILGQPLQYATVYTNIIDDNGRSSLERINILLETAKPLHAKLVKDLFDQAGRLKGFERTAKYKEAYQLKDKFAKVDYAYAITSHKSQGSTYDEVLVYEDDILSVAPISNKNKSQSIYTAITRAKHKVIIASDKNKQVEKLPGCNNSLS